MNNILLNFSKWIHWSERNTLESIESKGVYMLKCFEQRVIPTDVSLAEPLIYIGETCDQNFRKRFNQFNRSAFSERKGHSGGCKFFSTYNLNEVPQWFYLAILPFQYDEPKRSAYIRYVERKLIWEYVCFHNALPICNTR